MWITDGVDLPDAVLDAHSAGSLVFFVGAGASMDPPSGLPSFKQLGKDLAAEAHVPFDEDAAIDSFLGSMPVDFETHKRAHALINRKDSRPNATHSAIVGVAAAGELRIVTTNFDDHHAGAALASGVRVSDKWIGPALPPGDSFRGIVHLHGSVVRAPAELVLTDRDFGRAYLNDAWATRFLQKMFDAFTVVFIGYSHDDPIMRYLALGLPSRTHRFVLTHQPNDEKWEHLGITPIGYRANGNDHSAMVYALEAWSQRARMGQLDHRARMQQIIVAGPAMMPVDEDYVKHRLSSTEGAREFAAFARGTEWLLWAEGLATFKGMFAGASAEPASDILAHWFGTHFVADQAHNGAALQTVQRLGSRFSPSLYQSACWAAEQLSKVDEVAGRRWKVLLATSIEGVSAPASLGLLLPYSSGDRAEHRALLRVALRPFLELKRTWYTAEGDAETAPDAEVKWRTDDHVLNEHVGKAVEEAPSGDRALQSVLEDALNSAYELLAAYRGERDFDGLSFGRSAIEPHQQDRFEDPIDAVVNGLRDFGEKALPTVPDLPERWWDLGYGLFQRLGVHLIGFDTDRSQNSKLEWILDRKLLFEYNVKHEAYRVIATSLRSATQDLKRRLLEDTLTGKDFPTDIENAERHRDYAVFNLLVWLTSADPDWTEAAAARRAMEQSHPDFGAREHPDFDHWSSSGTWGDTPPVSPDDFIQAADIDLPRAVDDLLAHDYSERDFDQPTWEGALSVVRQVTERRVDLGLALWDHIGTIRNLGTRADDIRRAITGGWEKADLGQHQLRAIDKVDSLVDDSNNARSVSQFLLSQIRMRAESPETRAIQGLRSVASRLMEVQADGFAHSENSDPAFLALNSWPGEITSFWLAEIGRRWREKSEDWTGLNSVERNRLAALLDGPAPLLDATRPAFASDVFFLFGADASFAEENVIPLFSEEDSAAQAWNAYLYHPRYNDRMLAAGFLDAVLDEWAWLENVGSHGLQSQFFGVVVSILSFAGITAEDRRALLDHSILATNGEHAAEFASSVLHLLSSKDVDPEAVWELWLRGHLVARLEGLPRTPSSAELSAWADLAPFVGAKAPEAMRLFQGRGVGFESDYRAPDWPKQLMDHHAAELVAHLTERMLHSTPSGFGAYSIAEMVRELRETLGSDMATPLFQAAVERGFLAPE